MKYTLQMNGVYDGEIKDFSNLDTKMKDCEIEIKINIKKKDVKNLLLILDEAIENNTDTFYNYSLLKL